MEAEKRAEDAQGAADQLVEQAQAVARDKEAEVASLNSRLERLQRISKQKRAEFDDMQVRAATRE
eukprot:scaffold42418_cov27-Prasinocladus_malaysianus.AAC.1